MSGTILLFASPSTSQFNSEIICISAESVNVFDGFLIRLLDFLVDVGHGRDVLERIYGALEQQTQRFTWL